jgi:hypothetical protein
MTDDDSEMREPTFYKGCLIGSGLALLAWFALAFGIMRWWGVR